MRTLSTLLCLLVVGLNTELTLAASACSEDFKNKNWASAIASCLAEGSHQSFRIGYSYSKINNCTESNKWYKKNDTASAYMNMSLSSCVSDTEKLKLIDQSIAKKPNAANYYWKGEFLSEDIEYYEYSQDALNYFLMSVESEYSGDYQKERAYESLKNLAMYISRHPSNIIVAHRLLDTSIAKSSLNANELKFYEEWIHTLVALPKAALEKYIELVNKHFGLSHQLYVQAFLFKEGIKEIKDTQEAYRLLLLASAEGSTGARYDLNDTEAKLTDTQVKAAKCLAKKSVNPNWFDRKLCEW